MAKSKTVRRKIHEGVVRVERGHYEDFDEVRNGVRHHGNRWVRDGEDIVTVELSADLAALLHRLGMRAARSKTGKSRIMDGAIEARVVARNGKVTT